MSRKARRSRNNSEGEAPELIGHRHARLEHILITELQSLITDEASDPALEGIRLLRVHLSPDGGHARVAYVVLAPYEREHEVGAASRAGLNRATSFLRVRLAHQLPLKKLPNLSFSFVGVDVVTPAP